MSKKSILIIRCGALGDLVCSTSIIEAVRLSFGEQTIIDFVSNPGTNKLFENDYRINKKISIKYKKIPLFFSKQKREIINYSKTYPYDFVFNLENSKYFNDLVKNINTKKTINISNVKIPNDIQHMVEKMKYPFKFIVNDEIFNKSFPKLIGSDSKDIDKKYNLPTKYLIISPSNSHQKRSIFNYRAWTNENWKQLINILSNKIQTVVIGNKNEDEFFDKLKPYPINVIDLVAKTSLPDLITIIKNAQGLIATDTGTAHIASATNTEVFALIGPTPAYETGPYQTPFNKVHIISSNLDCSPCYKTNVMKNCKDNICMKSITVKKVLNTLIEANIIEKDN
ncbi:MAG: glycosyltransferase family 9 protein [Campylobacterota bacterium]|nr:glycosyltransferase family 9 protein [Campylobacterota bacterium]